MEIKRGQPEVGGVDSQRAGHVHVRVPIEPQPDEHWRAIFIRPPTGYSMPVSMHRPQLLTHSVQLQPPDGEVDVYIDNLDERIHLTNVEYAREVRPQLEAAKRQREQAAVRNSERVDAARRKLGESTAP